VPLRSQGLPAVACEETRICTDSFPCKSNAKSLRLCHPKPVLRTPRNPVGRAVLALRACPHPDPTSGVSRREDAAVRSILRQVSFG
jgi:hypothetical protein